MKRTFWSITVAAPLLVAWLPASADSLSPMDRTFEASVGVFFLDTDTTVRLDASERDLGTEINLEDDLNLQKQDRLRVDGYWRFLPRHKVRFMYFDSSSESSRQIHKDIDFGDTTFPIDANVQVNFGVTIMELAYEYSFVKGDNLELSGTIGLHNLSVETALSASASSNVGLGGIDRHGKADADGPLPVIGLRGIWVLGEHFYFDGQAQFFSMKFQEYDGNLQDYKISFNWFPWKNVGFGVGYNQFTTRLNVDRERFIGKLRLEYGGPLLFVTGAF